MNELLISARRAGLNHIADTVAEALGITAEVMRDRRRLDREVVLARRVAALVILRRAPSARLHEVSAAVGYRDRASVDDARGDREAVQIAEAMAA